MTDSSVPGQKNDVSVSCQVKSSHHTALRARPRGRSQNTVSVHTIHVTSALTRSPHLEGSASSHRPRGAAVRPEGRRATHASEPPIHTLAAHTRGTDTARLPSRQLSSSPVHPLSTIIARHPCRKSPPSTSTQYNHLSSRSGWATNERLLRLHLRNRGAQTAPAPRAALPTRPRSTHGAPIRSVS